MKKKLTILAFGLLLAVGWTNVAQAQRLPVESPAQRLTKKVMPLTRNDVSSPVVKKELKHESKSPLLKDDFILKDVVEQNGVKKAPKRAQNRATITADATHVYSWYDDITYDWKDANGNPHNNKITEPASDSYQIAYLLGTTYMNPLIPGTKYSAVTGQDNPYNNVAYGWDIPNNSRWPDYSSSGSAGTNYSDLVIDLTSNIIFSSITVYDADGGVLTSFDCNTAVDNGQYGRYTYQNEYYYYYTFPGWSYSNYIDIIGFENDDNYYACYTWSSAGTLTIPASLLNGTTSIRVVIQAYSYEGSETMTVGGVGQPLTNTMDTYTWTFNGSAGGSNRVIPPYENGYTIFLVKVNDGVGQAPALTSNWNSGSDNLIDYIETYIDEVQLLTDGTRLNEGTVDAGTMFVYSGELNRFYFIGKGKNFFWDDDASSENTACAPTYNMYEEFSPTTTETGDEIDDFYSKLLYGNSYNVIHDCRAMNYFMHWFTMSGNTGTQHRSMTNMVFWIPDNRGVYEGRDYNEEYLPHVGLYTIVLEAEAVQVEQNYVDGNRNYRVDLDWVSSLNSILDFDVDQDYELWIYEYDTEGNPIAKEKVMDLIPDENGYIHNDTQHSYFVEQKRDSYTIVYRIKGWPKDATNSPGNNTEQPEKGTFYALSNLDPVLIPGYENFLSLGVEHYESDFVLDGNPEYAEHNYYRNFLTVDNQNPDDALTVARIKAGEDQYMLYRFDPDDVDDNEDPYLTEVADLLFTADEDKVEYVIDYKNQYYVDEANLVGTSGTPITGYTNPDALGCPTYGEIANISGGSSSSNIPQAPTYNNITITIPNYYIDFNSIQVKSNGTTVRGGSWTATTNGATWPSGWSGPTISAENDGYCTSSSSGGTITIPHSIIDGKENVTVEITARKYRSTSSNTYITISGATPATNTYTTIDYEPKTWSINPSGYTTLIPLNDFLDNSTYTQVGIVVFQLPWKSIQVKLQEEAGSASGYFVIQNNGKLRFVMPAGYNNANLKFVIHNAPIYDATYNPTGSEYADGTFTLTSSTGDSQTITIPEGNYVYGDRDYETIFTGISSGDVITITGTHTENGIPYNYSPDFSYIHVYVEGGNDGISENTPLNLDAIKFVDQFKAETKDDTHPYRYGYVLKAVGSDDQSSCPEIPVKHANSKLHGFYSLNEINGDTEAPLLEVNVMNAEANMTLSRDQEIYYYTLDRKPSTVNNATWEEISQLQRREDDSYMEMDDKLTQYEEQVCNPPAVTTPPTPWNVERYDTYDIQQGGYNSFMSYVPVIWTHGDQKNRRIKWDTEKQHNSYGAPIWKTGVAEVTLKSATAERQDAPSTSWTYGGEDCNLYMLNNVLAEAKMPTVNNVKYVPYMFRIFVKSNSDKLRGYQYVPAGVDPDKPGQHYDGDVINDTKLMCVWSGYMNDPRNIPAEGANYGPNGVSVSYDPATGICTFNKIKVDPTETGGDWDPNSKDNAIFAGLTDIITEENGVKSIDPDDLQIVVRFYYIVEGFDASMPGRGEGDDPAGYGVEGSGDPDAWTAIYDVIYNADVESVTYVNALGMTSDKPFDGMNIVITRYSNGMTTTRKVVR